MKRSFLLKILAVYIFILHGSSKELDYDYELQRTEPILADEESLFTSNLKIIRKGKEYFINGTVTFTTDFDDNYLVLSESLHSPRMNSNFMKTPFRLPPSTVCVFLNTTYKQVVQPDLDGKSNIPFVSEEGLCPFPKGTYYAKYISLSNNFFPQHLASGIWCTKLIFMKHDKCVGGVNLFFKVTPKE